MGNVENGYVGIESSACYTAFGDAPTTHAALLAGEVALKPTPVLGKDGGEAVPLAYSNGYDETVPPRWSDQLDRLAAGLPDEPWGTARYPVFVTSSNYDVASLYTYRKTGDTEYAKLGTPVNCLSYLRERYGWGPNSIALSHACVTAHLGIEMASRYLALGVAEKALVFSFDYISPFVAGGFHSLKILNEQFPAPYEERETGSIGLGDGSGYAVLSRRRSPFRLEANFLYNEMYHFTANDPSGSGFKTSAGWLVAKANGRPVWIKGHGTGTLDAGRLEAEAFAEALPESPLVAWKGALGHTLGSCGIVELAVVLESLKQGRAPGTVGSSGRMMTPTVSVQNLDTREFSAVALFSNAFGGAHAGCLVSYD